MQPLGRSAARIRPKLQDEGLKTRSGSSIVCSERPGLRLAGERQGNDVSGHVHSGALARSSALAGCQADGPTEADGRPGSRCRRGRTARSPDQLGPGQLVGTALGTVAGAGVDLAAEGAARGGSSTECVARRPCRPDAFVGCRCAGLLPRVTSMGPVLYHAPVCHELLSAASVRGGPFWMSGTLAVRHAP